MSSTTGAPPGNGPAPDFISRLDGELESLAQSGQALLPPFPAVALRVQNAMGRPDFGLAEVAHLVSADAALAADVLRCANSPLYRRGAPASNLTQAITRIGAHEVMRLLLASCLAVHAHAAGPLAPLRRTIWIEGIGAAAVCQELARLRGLKQEDAFLLGLLHDFGKIVACARIETFLEKEAGGACPAETWESVVERWHVSLGLALARRWQLPQPLVDVISAHHGRPGDVSACSAQLEVVQATDQVVGMMMSSLGLSSTDLEQVPALGKFVEREAVARVVQKIPEFVESFEAPAPAAPGPSTRISSPQTTLAPGARPVRFNVTVNSGRVSRHFTAAAIAPNGLAVLGSEPLVDRKLHETTIHAQPGPLHIWAMTRLSQREGASYRVELHPFALSGMERGVWSQLVAGANSGS